MNTNPNTAEESTRIASDASALAENAAGAANPARPMMGRISAAVSAIGSSARLLPAGLRLFRRYPVPSALALAGVICAVLAARSHGSHRPSR
jgi:hypothetical protein